MKDWSQNGEQQIILNHLKDFKGVGRFLDIGAYNGTDLSNTRALLEMGWSGVLVEPNPYNLVPLMDSCREFGERAIIIAAAVGRPQPFERLFLDDSPGRGWTATISGSLPGIIQPSPTMLCVPVIPVGDLMPLGPFQVIGIDAEWMDGEILRQFTADHLKYCKVFIIEPGGGDHFSNRECMKSTLRGRGFDVDKYATPENIIGVK